MSFHSEPVTQRRDTDVVRWAKPADVVDALEQIADKLIDNGFDREALMETREVYEKNSMWYLCHASEKFSMVWERCYSRYVTLTSVMVDLVDQDFCVWNARQRRFALLDVIEKQLNKGN